MTNLVRWDPFSDITSLRQTMDRLFDEGFSRPWRFLTWDTGEGFFPLDLYETDDEVVVRASLPAATISPVAGSIKSWARKKPTSPRQIPALRPNCAGSTSTSAS